MIAEVEYPSLGCSGSWTLNALTGDTLMVTESLGATGSCQTGWQYDVILDGGVLSGISTNFSGTFALSPTIGSNFVADADDWGFVNESGGWVASGGNPLGHLQTSDTGGASGSTAWYFSAPDKFLGNQSAAYGGELRYDLQQSDAAPTLTALPWVILRGAGVTLVYDAGGALPGTSWTPFAAPLDATAPGWHVADDACWTFSIVTPEVCNFSGAAPTQAQFVSVLSNLDTLLIRGEYSLTLDTGGLDNVELVSANNPVALWSADGNAFDSVGGSNGTLQNGAGYAAGRIGQAFSLDGVNQDVFVGDAPNLDLTNTMTMAAWIYPTGPGSFFDQGGIIVNKEWTYEMARFADGTIRWAFGNGVNSFLPTNDWINTGVVAPLNTWTHVAITYNYGIGTAYINGVEVNSTYLGSDVLGAGTQPFRIGGRGIQVQVFDGLIDDVRLYDTALDPAEVLGIFNAAP